MRQVWLINSALKHFVQARWINYTKVCVKIAKKNQSFLADPPVLKSTVLFEPKQLEQVTICITTLQIYYFLPIE